MLTFLAFAASAAFLSATPASAAELALRESGRVATAVQTSDDEKAEEAKILAEWDAFADAVRKAKRDLADLQLRYNGSENEDAKKSIESDYNILRASTAERARTFWKSVDAFLTKYPKNMKVRQRRLDDTIFDHISPKVRAQDADTLGTLVTAEQSGEYLHKSAKFYEKAYDFAAAAARWKAAADKAQTFQVMKDLGNVCMNALDFPGARSAYQRASELASAQKDKQDIDRLVELATKYVGYWEIEQELRRQADEKKDLPLIEIVTDRGTMVCELFEDQAPNTVANIVELAEKKDANGRGYFDGLAFHRCIAGFMIQGGDPTGNGQGGPGYNVKDEFSRPDARMHFPGTLSMANTGRPDTGGSQFFVTNATTYHLNGRHTVFGRVVSGLEVAQVQPIDAADPQNKAAPFKIVSVKVLRKRDHPYVAEKIQSGGGALPR
jgi:cyclophilin family peptidyl-prolyl cis-trans isomerase